MCSCPFIVTFVCQVSYFLFALICSHSWMCVVDCWRNGLGVPKSEETAKHIEETMLKKRTKKVDDAKQ